MKPRITVITLGVNDLEKAVEFYRDGLGFPTQGIVGTEYEHGAVAFFDLQGGLRVETRSLVKKQYRSRRKYSAPTTRCD